MYLEGLGFRSIGRVIGVSHSSVIKWVKKYGEQSGEINKNNYVPVVEMDELHNYIGQKKTTAGYGPPLTEKESFI